MLLTFCLLDDIIRTGWVVRPCLLKMKSPLCRQWVASTVVIAMLFGMAVPVAVCKCDGCHCPKSIARLLAEQTAANEKCACSPADNAPCPCQCCDVHSDDTTTPVAVLPEKNPNVKPSWHTISVLPIGFAQTAGLPFQSDNTCTLLPPHVPLHVSLCVFRN